MKLLKYVNLSLENLNDESLKLAKNIQKTFTPDLVVYIAKGGYLIGQNIANYFAVENVGIHAERRGNKLKERLAPLLEHIPQRLKFYLRKIELISGLHGKHSNRNVYWDISQERLKDIRKKRKILIVDDSVDTGYSMLSVVKEINRELGNKAVIKTAAINCWEKSATIIKVDFFNYIDTIIETPMSKDSKEYPIFKALYNNRK